jgi:hypothetical protein
MKTHRNNVFSHRKNDFEIGINDVGYPSYRLEYMLSRFAFELIPTLMSLIPSRTQRALPLSFITFFHQIFCPLRKMQNITKKCQKKRQFLCISCPDSLKGWFQLYSHWFQVELDELYRFQYSPVPPDCPLPPKNAENCKKWLKFKYFLPRFVSELIPTLLALIPDRARRALSISHIHSTVGRVI